MTKDGLRIPIVDMTDDHLVRTMLVLDAAAKRIKDLATRKVKAFETLLGEPESFDDNLQVWEDWVEDRNWDNPFVRVSTDYRALSKMFKYQILMEMVPCFPTLVLEGYKRGILHSNGYPNNEGFKLINRKKEQDDG